VYNCFHPAETAPSAIFEKKILLAALDRQNMTMADLDRCREAYFEFKWAFPTIEMEKAASGRQPFDVAPLRPRTLAVNELPP